MTGMRAHYRRAEVVLSGEEDDLAIRRLHRRSLLMFSLSARTRSRRIRFRSSVRIGVVIKASAVCAW